MTVRTKLLASVGLLFSVIILIISMVGYNDFKSASVSGVTHELDSESFLIAKAIEQKMNRYFDVLEFTAGEIDIDSRGELNMDTLLPTLAALKTQFQVLNAYVGIEDGRTYSVNKNGLIKNFDAKKLKREWYLRGLAKEPRIITTPYTSASNNLVMAVAVPIVREGKALGVLSINLAINEITQFIDGLSEDNQIFVSREDGFVIASKYPDYIGKNLFELRPSYKAFHGKDKSQHSYQFEGDDYLVVETKVPSYDWQVWVWSPWQAIYSPSNENLIVTTIMAVVFILLALVVIFYLIQKLMYIPIGGEPSDIEATVKKVASGDLSAINRATGKETGIYGAILMMGNNLKGIVTEINAAAEQLNMSSEQMMRAAGSVNDRSKTQMEQLEMTATAMNEMTMTVEEVARNAQTAATSASDANQSSSDGMTAVEDMNHNISALVSGIEDVQKVIQEVDTETDRMGSILDVIKDIADQTNLLALNAAIEAARAGEQGRGFAVVADEVRSLATRTQQSTDEIQAMITNLRNAAKNSVSLMQKNADDANLTGSKSEHANNSLIAIRDSVTGIQDMNHQIAAAAEEQAQAVGEINRSIVGINDLAKETFEASENNIHSAGNLAQVADQLNKSVESFKL